MWADSIPGLSQISSHLPLQESFSNKPSASLILFWYMPLRGWSNTFMYIKVKRWIIEYWWVFKAHTRIQEQFVFWLGILHLNCGPSELKIHFSLLKVLHWEKILTHFTCLTSRCSYVKSLLSNSVLIITDSIFKIAVIKYIISKLPLSYFFIFSISILSRHSDELNKA